MSAKSQKPKAKKNQGLGVGAGREVRYRHAKAKSFRRHFFGSELGKAQCKKYSSPLLLDAQPANLVQNGGILYLLPISLTSLTSFVSLLLLGGFE